MPNSTAGQPRGRSDRLKWAFERRSISCNRDPQGCPRRYKPYTSIHAVTIVSSIRNPKKRATYTAIDLVKERRTESSNDCEQKHRGCDASRLDIEPLRLSLDGSEAHGETRQKEDTRKDTETR